MPYHGQTTALRSFPCKCPHRGIAGNGVYISIPGKGVSACVAGQLLIGVEQISGVSGCDHIKKTDRYGRADDSAGSGGKLEKAIQ